MTGFVLIPKNLYDDLVVGSSFPTQHNKDTDPVQEAKLKLLDSVSKHKSQLLPFVENPVRIQQDNPFALQPNIPPQSQNILSPSEENILSSISLTGVSLKRAKLILEKFLKNTRLGLSSNTNTILVDGVDTDIPLSTFLYKLQKTKLNSIERDIKNILDVKPHEMRREWVRID